MEKAVGMTTNTFTDNGFGTRTSKTDSTGKRDYLRDGVGVTSPVLSDGAATYTPGISERRGTTSTYQLSGLKNTSAQSDASGGHVSSRNYDAFGAVTSSSGTHQGPFGYGGPYGYQTDPDTGLMLLGHRFYDPSVGRFLTRDPIKDGRNWYGYGGGWANPVNSVDPDGLVKIILFWYHVAGGGYHTGLLIIDNARGATQPTWSFAGGPDVYTIGGGRLVTKSGPWARGTQDFDKSGGWWNGSGIVLVDDDSPMQPWIDKFQAHETDMISIGDIDYDVTPIGWNSGNSNSWAHELLRRSGLTGAYEKAIDKRGGSPWVPGWGANPWR